MKRNRINLTNKMIAFLVAFLLLFTSVPAPVKASADEVIKGIYENLSYTIYKGEASITDCEGALGEVVIPATIDGYPVKKIRERAFYWSKGVKKIVIPEGVEIIERDAFSDSGIETIVLPESVTSIGKEAFWKCEKLTSIVIPSKVTVIDYFTFLGCANLKSITIPESVTTIRSGAFTGCSSLTEIKLPSKLTYIDGGLLKGCSSLENIKIPDSVTVIGGEVFADCTNVKSIEIPKSAELVGDRTFLNCVNLEAIVIPEETTKIGEYSFYGCEKLKDIVIPEKVNKINDCAFANCAGLEDVTIPKSVTYIGNAAFSNCNNILNLRISDMEQWFEIDFFSASSNPMYYSQNIYIAGEKVNENFVIPQSVTSIQNYAFAGVKCLESITFPKNLKNIATWAFVGSKFTNLYISDLNAWWSVESSLHNNPMEHAEHVYVDGKELTELVIPEGIEVIKPYLFLGCKSLKRVVFPEGVTTIGTGAFSDCENLQEITVSDKVKAIGSNAFSGCKKIEKLYIGSVSSWCRINFADSYSNPMIYAKNLYIKGQLLNGVLSVPSETKEINRYAFYGCNALEEVIIEDGVETISLYAFKECINLKKVTIPTSVTVIEGASFSECDNLDNVIIPESVITLGNGTFFGCDSLVNVVLPNSIKNISQNLFSECSSLNNIIIPNSVTKIGKGAFSGCAGLTHIIIPDNVVDLEDNIFENCSELERVVMSKNLTKVSSFMFANCSKLVDITLPDSIKVISKYAFSGCSSLKGIQFPEVIESIGDHAFKNCANLQSVTIPNSITVIEDGTFWGCTGLKNIVIPNSVTKIGASAFSRCLALTDIKLPENITEIDSQLLKDCESLKNVTIPKGVKRIETFAFKNCKSLTSVTLPDELTAVLDQAFWGCSSIKEIRIPRNYKVLQNHTFNGCEQLTKVVFEGEVERISENAFLGCSKDLTLFAHSDYVRQYAIENNINYKEITHQDNDSCVCELCWKARNIDSVTISKLPDKLQYCIGETLDMTGVELKVSYDNGESEIITSGYTINHFDSTVAGICTVTVSVSGCQGQFDIEVFEHDYVLERFEVCFKCSGRRVVSSLEIESLPNKVKYNIGDEFDKDGLNVKVHYQDGFSRTLYAHEYTIAGYNSLQEGVCEILVKYKGVSTAFNIQIIGPQTQENVMTELYGLDNVKINWSTTVGANAYCIYYKKSTDSSFTFLEKTTETAYEKNNLEKGVEYTFKVTPAYVYGESVIAQGMSKEVNITTLKLPTEPKVLSAELYGHDDVMVKWSKSNDATGYTIYYKKSTAKTYTCLGNTSRLYVKKENLADGEKYIFKVVPYRTVKESVYNGAAKTVTVTTLKVPVEPKSLKAELYGHDDVMVKWSKVKNAKGYTVYYKKSTAKTYTRLGNTSKLYVKKGNLADGAKYTFKIVPYNSAKGYTCNGNAKTISIYTLKKIGNSKIKKYSSKKVKVSWSNISGESGYQISKSTSKKETSITTTYKTTSGKAIKISAKKGVKYYYKVRAYKNVNGKKVYGPWSDTVAYKLK